MKPNNLEITEPTAKTVTGPEIMPVRSDAPLFNHADTSTYSDQYNAFWANGWAEPFLGKLEDKALAGSLRENGIGMKLDKHFIYDYESGQLLEGIPQTQDTIGIVDFDIVCDIADAYSDYAQECFKARKVGPGPLTGEQTEILAARVIRKKALKWLFDQGFHGTRESFDKDCAKLPCEASWWRAANNTGNAGESARVELGLEYLTPAGADY